MHPPSHARRVAELLGGDPPVTVVPGVEQIGLLVIFEEALRFATFGGPQAQTSPGTSLGRLQEGRPAPRTPVPAVGQQPFH
jgi:hypothetical protein